MSDQNLEQELAALRQRIAQLESQPNSDGGNAEAQLAFHFANAPLGIIEWNRDIRVMQWSEGAERILGWKAEEVMGKHWEEWPHVHEDDLDYARNKVAQFLQGEQGREDVIVRNYHKDGTVVWVHWHGSLMRNEQGEIVSLLTFVRDVTAQKQAEASLRESESRFRTLAQLAPVGIFFSDVQGSCIYINPKGSEIVGLSEQEALGFGWAERIHPDDRARVRSGWERCVSDTIPFKLEYRFQHKDETVVWVIGESVPIMSDAGDIQGHVGVLTDITQEKQIEQEHIRAQRLLALGDLSAGVSHNLNNILTGILGPAQLLETMTDDPQLRNEINVLVEASLRTKDLVHRLHLSTHDVSDGRLRKVDVNKIAREAVLTTQPRWKDESESNGIVIDCELELSDDVLPIRGNQTRLHDMFVNLILNAVDALPQGGTITIRTQNEDNYVQVDVIDTGVGMSEEVQEKIFEPFFTTKMTVGPGLGLSTVHKTITSWGGRIDVDSTLGKGTTMTLILPIWEEVASAKLSELPDMRSGNLLVVDDDEIVCMVLARMLSQNHTVEGIQDPHKALAQFVPGHYDVAFIDQGMSGLPGHEVAYKIRLLDPHIAIILITGWEIPEDDPRRAPFDFHLQKPFEDMASVHGVLAQALALCDERKEEG